MPSFTLPLIGAVTEGEIVTVSTGEKIRILRKNTAGTKYSWEFVSSESAEVVDHLQDIATQNDLNAGTAEKWVDAKSLRESKYVVREFEQNRGFDLPLGSTVKRNGVLYEPNSIIPDGTSFLEGDTGLTFSPLSPNIVLDGTNYNLSRADAITGVAPTVGEVATPLDGDTAVVFLTDGTREYYSHNGTSWSLNVTVPPTAEMVGATDLLAGVGGSTPTPQAGDENKALFGDATWREISSGEWEVVTSADQVLEGGKKYIVNGFDVVLPDYALNMGKEITVWNPEKVIGGAVTNVTADLVNPLFGANLTGGQLSQAAVSTYVSTATGWGFGWDLSDTSVPIGNAQSGSVLKLGANYFVTTTAPGMVLKLRSTPFGKNTVTLARASTHPVTIEQFDTGTAASITDGTGAPVTSVTIGLAEAGEEKAFYGYGVGWEYIEPIVPPSMQFVGITPGPYFTTLDLDAWIAENGVQDGQAIEVVNVNGNGGVNLSWSAKRLILKRTSSQAYNDVPSNTGSNLPPNGKATIMVRDGVVYLAITSSRDFGAHIGDATLKAISSNALATGDTAHIGLDAYIYDSDYTGEDRIIPDSSPATGGWRLQSSLATTNIIQKADGEEPDHGIDVYQFPDGATVNTANWPTDRITQILVNADETVVIGGKAEKAPQGSNAEVMAFYKHVDGSIKRINNPSNLGAAQAFDTNLNYVGNDNVQFSFTTPPTSTNGNMVSANGNQLEPDTLYNGIYAADRTAADSIDSFENDTAAVVAEIALVNTFGKVGSDFETVRRIGPVGITLEKGVYPTFAQSGVFLQINPSVGTDLDINIVGWNDDEVFIVNDDVTTTPMGGTGTPYTAFNVNAGDTWFAYPTRNFSKLHLRKVFGAALRGNPVLDEAALTALPARDYELRLRKDTDAEYRFKLTDDLTASENAHSANLPDDAVTGKWILQTVVPITTEAVSANLRWVDQSGAAGFTLTSSDSDFSVKIPSTNSSNIVLPLGSKYKVDVNVLEKQGAAGTGDAASLSVSATGVSTRFINVNGSGSESKYGQGSTSFIVDARIEQATVIVSRASSIGNGNTSGEIIISEIPSLSNFPKSTLVSDRVTNFHQKTVGNTTFTPTVTGNYVVTFSGLVDFSTTAVVNAGIRIGTSPGGSQTLNADTAVTVGNIGGANGKATNEHTTSVVLDAGVTYYISNVISAQALSSMTTHIVYDDQLSVISSNDENRIISATEVSTGRVWGGRPVYRRQVKSTSGFGSTITLLSGVANVYSVNGNVGINSARVSPIMNDGTLRVWWYLTAESIKLSYAGANTVQGYDLVIEYTKP